MAQYQIQSVGYWHERLADWMIANPGVPMREAAKFFDKTQTWISIVKNSDAFKRYWEQRSGEHSEKVSNVAVGAMIGVTEKTAAMTEMALDELMNRLETQGPVMTVDTLLSVADTGLKRLGYGASKTSQPPQVQVGVSVTVDRRAVEQARDKMRSTFGVESNAELASSTARPESKLIEGSTT